MKGMTGMPRWEMQGAPIIIVINGQQAMEPPFFHHHKGMKPFHGSKGKPDFWPGPWCEDGKPCEKCPNDECLCPLQKNEEPADVE